MMESLFNQSAVWTEVVPSSSSLAKEGSTEHTLGRVFASPQKSGSTADTMGYRDDSNATLYYLVGTSTVDGRTMQWPGFKRGDRINIDGKSLTVVGSADYKDLDGRRHHMEVFLR